MGFSVSYTYRLIDKFSTNAKKISASTKTINKKIKGTDKALGAISTFASAAALYKMTNDSMKFSDAMSDVDRVMNLTQKGSLKKFTKTIKDLSVPLVTMPEDLAKMAYEAGKVGIADADMKRFLTITVKTQKAFDMTAEAAGSALADLKTKLSLNIDETERLMNQVNYLADNTSASGERMINIIGRVSGEFALMNFSTDQIAAFSAAADQISTSSELAASGLNMAFNRLQKSPIYRAKFQKAPVQTFISILENLKKMDAVSRNMKISKLFGDEAGRFIKKAVANVDKFRDALRRAAEDKAIKSMDAEFQKFLNRNSASILRLRIRFNKMFISIGDAFLSFYEKHKEAIEGAMDGITRFVEKNQDLVAISTLVLIALIAISGIFTLLSLTAIPTLIGALVSLGIAFMEALWPVVLVIGAIILNLYAYYELWSWITGKTISGVEKMKSQVADYLTISDESLKLPTAMTQQMPISKPEGLDITGKFLIEAEKGTKVKKTEIKANQGTNSYSFRHGGMG